MREPQKPPKRIISKSSYAALLAKKFALGTGSVGLAILTAVCILVGFGFLCAGFITSLNTPSLLNMLWFGGWIASWLLAWLLCKTAEQGMAQARKAENVVPLTRANVSQLPANESLLRGSDKPIEAQQSILLRPAAPHPETATQQLVIPIQGDNNSGTSR